jgi:hypothetical protein
MIKMFIVSGIIIGIILLEIFMINLENKPPSNREITYGEFPFRLEYEIDGERFVIEDIVIAEFEKSIRGNMTAQARRIWNTRLENGKGGSSHLGLSFALRQIDDITITF